jgi:hypothetical protein
MKRRKVIVSFVVSFIYVLLGTIVVMVSFPKYEILGFNSNHPFWLPVVIITLPANVFLFGLVIVEDSFAIILVLQIIVFLLLWLVCYNFFKKVWRD